MTAALRMLAAMPPVFSKSDAPAMAPADAATIVLLTDSDEGLRVLLLRRHAKSRFMAGAYVFPGGRVDPADASGLVAAEDAAWCRMQLDPSATDAALDEGRATAFHVAAVRELFEEAGILLGRPQGGTTDELSSDQWRQKLADARRRLNAEKVSFANLLEELSLEIDVRLLRYWAHWITPSFEKRRYDTRFFLAWAPVGQTADFDDIETTDQAWLGLGQAVVAHHLLKIFLAPPTLRTIEELQAYQTRAALQAEPPSPVPAIMPKVRLAPDGVRVLMPWHSDYATTDGEGKPAEPLARQSGYPPQVLVRRPQVDAAEEDRAQAILRFWFGDGGDGVLPDESRSKLWFGKGADFDEACKSFTTDLHRAVDGGYDDWQTDPQHDLARIILVDQLSRNIYRDDPRAFAKDAHALKWAREGIKAGRAHQLPPLLRWFYLLPLMHAEDLSAQQQQVVLFEAMVDEVPERARKMYEGTVGYARRHHEIIARFGRFPHRNALLGRDSTPEELAFLQEPGSRF